MARKIKKNKNMALSALLREEDDSSGDDNQRKRDDNNRAVERRPVNSRMRAQQMRDMARKIKKNKNMPLSALLREEDDSSGDDNQRKRDDNNRAVERRPVNSRMRAQTALRRLNQLRAEKKMLEEKQQILLKEFLLNLFMARAAGISQIDLSKSVHNVLLSYATSDTLENDLTKPQSS